ncbi:NAD(P)/FAD-dependent oxidoreductase [Parasporobacterium paucivorans]|uniref:Pyridine nucleotide-disulphide oxidoreductase n=1 Tax=Parasporobacterium paucivorans DSM 15970 TaxID=1122934 RepID=A0A1M6ITD2_9FIRM|nr:FAD-dependent oxidoreductase [Parasporobacterium paucivorans]SHJ37706.1 Pyridine nucleotide-disulphide oxidoreductase [Parasporobacterium paucivorans DSM 15970]
MNKHYVIIGNSAAGIFAADAIRERDQEGLITVISEETQDAYSRCLTTYYVSGYTDRERMMLRPSDYYETQSINFLRGLKVTKIDAPSKQVILSSGVRVSYDTLLIASGASPRLMDIPDAKPGDVHVMRTMKDADALIKKISNGQKRVCVLGAGLVSLKTASALAEHGLDITIVVTSQHILSQQFDSEGADILYRHLKNNGVRFLFGLSASRVLHDSLGAVSGVELNDGSVVSCDFIFMGKGVNPNTSFIPEDVARIQSDWIEVDDHMKTSVPDIYAAGDCVMAKDKLFGGSRSYALWPNATEQGQIAGANMAGSPVAYEGALSMNSLQFFGLHAICGGDGRGSEAGSFAVILSEPERNQYRKFVFQNRKLTGFILIGKTKNAGVLMQRLGKELSPEECHSLLDHGVIAEISVK